MIKIERSTAVNATIVRNSVRQPVTLNMHITEAELGSLTADSGSITYSVDELEVKIVDFQPAKPVDPAPVIDEAPAPVIIPAPKIAKPIIQPARKTAKTTQA
jgi:hypothetical protein